jgi:hypothetical protein
MVVGTYSFRAGCLVAICVSGGHMHAAYDHRTCQRLPNADCPPLHGLTLPFMSRGIVLWPDPATGKAVRDLWSELADAGLPSVETHTHGPHQPHVSLVVAESFDVQAAKAAVGAVPSTPIPCRAETAALYRGGALLLPLVANHELLAEHDRVSNILGELPVGRWPHTKPGVWMPHMTCAYNLASDQVAQAVSIALRYLPLSGSLTTGGVEDGTTGENWPI